MSAIRRLAESERRPGSRSTRWPNLFVVGVPKAGTTTLHAHLGAHPRIYMAEPKEPHFLARRYPPPALEPFVRRVRREEDYLRLFEAARAPVVGEASTSYFADPEAPHNIREVAPDAKVVVVLREPVQRAYSHYLNHVREGIERRSFLTAIEEELGVRAPTRDSRAFFYVDGGFYAERVQLHRRLFGASFKAVFFEELFDDLSLGLRDLYEFLGVDVTPAERIGEELRMNAYAKLPRGASRSLLGSPRARRFARALLPRPLRSRVRDTVLREAPKPPTTAEVVSLLTSTYALDRERLESALKRPVPW